LKGLQITFGLVLLLAPIAAKAGEIVSAPLGQQAAPAKVPPVQFPFSYTGEVLGNLSGGYKQGAVYDGLVSLGVQIDLERIAAWKGGMLLVSAIDAHGGSLTNKFVHDLNCVSNIDTDNSLRLYEVWLQQQFYQGKISIRLGQILADSEFFVSDAGSVFINSAFGALPVISLNLPAPIFPVPAPGVRVHVDLNDQIAVQSGVFCGNAGDPFRDNRHGVDWKLNRESGALFLSELIYRPQLKPGGSGLRATYKLGGFYHSSRFDSNQGGDPRHGNFGGYVIADQELWHERDDHNQGLSGFMRLGAAPSDRNTACFYMDTGFNYTGLLPGHTGDVAGLGFSYTKLSSGLRDSAGMPVETHHEAILDLTYQATINNAITVQPDFQYVFNPGGTAKARDAIICGIRFTVSFGIEAVVSAAYPK